MSNDPAVLALLKVLEELLATQIRLEACLHQIDRATKVVHELLTLPAPPTPIPASRLLRFPEVRARTGLSRSTIWRLERAGKFPQHRIIAKNTIAWFDYDITVWVEQSKKTPAKG